MDSVTREIVKKRKAARKAVKAAKKLTQAAERERQYAKALEAGRLKADKRHAVRDVSKASHSAGRRLSTTAWTEKGSVVRVCNFTGPHSDGWCLLHLRKRVTLVKIPGAVGGCATSGLSLCDTVFGEGPHRSIYLGSDGRVYRVGHTKVFRAKLMDRKYPDRIRGLIPKLDAMS